MHFIDKGSLSILFKTQPGVLHKQSELRDMHVHPKNYLFYTRNNVEMERRNTTQDS